MTETAKMYGGSLYDLAAEEGLETRILGELDEVQQLLKQNPDYLRLLSTPSIPKKERCGLLDEALRGQVHLYVLNFLKILWRRAPCGSCPAAHGLTASATIRRTAFWKPQPSRLFRLPSSSARRCTPSWKT